MTNSDETMVTFSVEDYSDSICRGRNWSVNFCLRLMQARDVKHETAVLQDVPTHIAHGKTIHEYVNRRAILAPPHDLAAGTDDLRHAGSEIRRHVAVVPTVIGLRHQDI